MPDRFRDAELADLETLVALDSDDEFLDVLLAAYAERDEEREEERLGRHWLVLIFTGWRTSLRLLRGSTGQIHVDGREEIKLESRK